MNKSLINLDNSNFAEAFGTDEAEVSRFCGYLIKTLDFQYKVCDQETREKIFLDVIKKCDSAELSVSGERRKPDWIKGWNEILQDFRDSGGNLKSLIPKYYHSGRPLRYKGNYIIPSSDSFEPDFFNVFRHWLYQKYFKVYKNIYEFGCGTGHNLTVMAQLLPGKKFFGMDWVPQSQELLGEIAKKYNWPISGINFDFFHPNKKLKLLPDSLIYTSAALEQVGSDYGDFLDYLIANKPALCVNVECMAEYYDEYNLYDYVALRYHKARNYLDGFPTYLRSLEKQKKIKIIADRRTGFGGLYHEGLMYIIWKIL